MKILRFCTEGVTKKSLVTFSEYSIKIRVYCKTCSWFVWGFFCLLACFILFCSWTACPFIFSLEGTFSFENVDRYILNMMNRLLFGFVFVQAFSFSLCLPAVLSLLGKMCYICYKICYSLKEKKNHIAKFQHLKQQSKDMISRRWRMDKN